jgi:hypothetical protein
VAENVGLRLGAVWRFCGFACAAIQVVAHSLLDAPFFETWFSEAGPGP